MDTYTLIILSELFLKNNLDKKKQGKMGGKHKASKDFDDDER